MPTNIFRISHYSNLPLILANGMICSNNAPSNVSYSSIGNSSVVQARNRKRVLLMPFGVLNDYVPFYFGIHSVMLLNIHTSRVPGVTCGQTEIIYLRSSVEQIVGQNLPFVFTDGHGLEAITTQYGDINDLTKLDWNVINAKQWANTTQDNDRQRRKQAEFLVFQNVPKDCILEIGVYDDNMKTRIDTVLAANNCSNIPCNVRRNWYY